MNFKFFLSLAAASSLLTSSIFSNNITAFADSASLPSSDSPASSDTKEKENENEKEDEKIIQYKCVLNVDNAENELNKASVNVDEKNNADVSFSTDSGYHISEIIINGSALPIKSVYSADDNKKLSLTLEKDTEIDIKFTKNTPKCTVSFLDYDGKVITTQSVEYNKKIDYSVVDTSSESKFFQQIDTTMQIRFSSWDNDVTFARDDITVQALSQKASINIQQLPTKTTYYFPGQPIDLSGLKISLTIETQKPEFLNDGSRKIQSENFFVEEICYTDYTTVSEVFKNSPDGEIKIYAPNNSVPITSYKISLNQLPANNNNSKGDIDSSGVIDASDASYVLSVYSALSTSAVPDSLTDVQFSRADVDSDGFINASDASYILMYYSLSSSGGKPEWDTILNG